VLLGRRVAIKLLAERFQYDAAAMRRFQREARTAARLSGHRHVVTIFDVGEVDGRAFIVMEYLAGGTVADALRRGPVEQRDALRWLREAAAALDHAHRRGVVHRDVKPGNLLLDADRVLHIGDFGIARLATEDTVTASGQLLGTAAYVSPEQALGRTATPASDRYSLAVAAFELLTGERPFRAQHFAAQARQHIEAEPPRASARDSRLPRALDPVLARGLAKRPENRWPTAGAMVAAMEAVLADRRTTSPTWRPRPAAMPGARRRRRRAGALAALLAGALAAAIVAGAADQGTSTRLRGSRAAKPRSAQPQLSAPRTRPGASSPTPSEAVAAPPSTVGEGASALEAHGHKLMLDGSYDQAIPVLRQAVASAAAGSLTYAYALYDLGRSLRLAGQPQAAIPNLERRLQIPDQTGAVRRELALAIRQAGGGAAAAPSADGHGTAGPSAGKNDRGKHGQGGGNNQAD
jgi:serine/threonine-protein kinase